MTIDQLEQELLKLPATTRARLARQLISSLDDDEVDRAWTREVHRRDEELRAGEIEALPPNEALQAVRDRFGW